MFTHLILTATRRCALSHWSHLTDEKKQKRHRKAEQLDRNHRAKNVVELSFKHRSYHCKACALTHYPFLLCY